MSILRFDFLCCLLEGSKYHSMHIAASLQADEEIASFLNDVKSRNQKVEKQYKDDPKGYALRVLQIPNLPPNSKALKVAIEFVNDIMKETNE